MTQAYNGVTRYFVYDLSISKKVMLFVSCRLLGYVSWTFVPVPGAHACLSVIFNNWAWTCNRRPASIALVWNKYIEFVINVLEMYKINEKHGISDFHSCERIRNVYSLVKVSYFFLSLFKYHKDLMINVVYQTQILWENRWVYVSLVVGTSPCYKGFWRSKVPHKVPFLWLVSKILEITRC